MSVANLKTKIMITAEEFFRNKIKEKNPNIEVVTLSRELITAEEGMRWAHEFKQLHLHAVSGRSEQFYCVSSNALVYGKPCEKWCGDENCKSLCKQ